MQKMTTIDDFDLPFTTEDSRRVLTQRQVAEYEQVRKRFGKWLLTVGKDPNSGKGYSEYTVEDTLYRMDRIHRHVWNTNEGTSLHLSKDQVGAFFDDRTKGFEDWGESDNAGYLKAAKRYFKWQKHELGGSEWDPDWSFRSDLGHEHNQPKYTVKEVRKLEEAVLEYKSIPNRETTPVDERDKWRTHLAQRFGKAKEDVVPADWERARSWKWPSLMSVTIDTGLRPCEVGAAKVGWFDADNGVLRIPIEDSAKNTDNWVMGLRARTIDRLQSWIDERECYDKYDDTDKLWLTRESNPYQSGSLQYFLEQLSEVAGVDRDTHHWYMLRRNLATELADAKTMEHASDQLRHQSTDTTERYVQTSPEQRKEGLETMFSDD